MAPGPTSSQEAWSYLAAIVESSDDAIITKDLNGTITSWNTGAQRLFGYSAQEAIGNPIAMLIPADRQDEEPEILARLRRGQRIDHYETIRRRKDGTLLEISLTVSPILDETGAVIGASKIARDISARKFVENATSFLAAVVESSDDAIVTKDLNGVITTWNHGAEKLFGYTAAEAIGKSVSMLLPQERLNEEPAILARLRRGESISHYETIRCRKDGSRVPISLTISPVRDAMGRVVGASKIARDITEIQQAREAVARSHEELERLVHARTASLERALAQLEEFSYTVSHDLRAPVRAMEGFAKALLEDYGDRLDDSGRDLLFRIKTAGVRMQNLIQDVLIYSKLARSEVTLEPVALKALIQDVIQSYPALQSPNVEIAIREPLQTVVGHRSSLTQAVSNLLSNAVKFVPEGRTPKVKIWTEAHNGTVRLWIQDNGIGIKPKYQHRLFGMFERVPQGGEYEGTGIGLAIVRKAMEKMGGHAGMESDGLNGSKFWIELRSTN